jgi:uncharacterized protein (UPF0332 family)
MLQLEWLFLGEAEESLAGAESEYANRRYNNCANRCYYACFQAAIYALILAGVRPPGRSGAWGHDFVQARFNGELIARRKRYPSQLRDALRQTYILREKADYELDVVSEVRAARALSKASAFVAAVRSEGGELR